MWFSICINLRSHSCSDRCPNAIFSSFLIKIYDIKKCPGFLRIIIFFFHWDSIFKIIELWVGLREFREFLTQVSDDMRCSALIGSFFTIEWWWIGRAVRWESAWSCTESHYWCFKVSTELFWFCFLLRRHFDTSESQVFYNNHSINHVRASYWGPGTFVVSFWTDRWTFKKLRVEPWPLDVDCSQTERNFKIW